MRHAELSLGDDSFRLIAESTLDGHRVQESLDARERAREEMARAQRPLDLDEIPSR